MEEDRFKELKEEILKRAHEAYACEEQYKRAYKAETLAELMCVIKDNFGWVLENEVITFELVEQYRTEFAHNNIHLNTSNIKSGFLLLNDYSAEVEGTTIVYAHGKSKVNAFNNTLVWAYDETYVNAWASTKVYGHDTCKIVAHNASVVIALDNVWVDALNSSIVTAHDYSYVNARDHSTVRAFGNAFVTARHKSYVETNSEIKDIRDHAICRIRNSNIVYCSMGNQIKEY